jgi:hypothetical protein
MWPIHYSERLQQWADLRACCDSQELDSVLLTINNWWWRAPMVTRYLHWDDRRTWPTPWELLADNTYCDLARALGIVYTIMMVEHEKIQEVSLISTDNDNLVQVNHGKYILNWAPGEILNIHSADIKVKKSINSSEINHLLG